MDWVIRKAGLDPESYADDGNRFLVGNGYMGVRGTLDEHTKAELAAVNLAGIYDKAGSGWREPLNAPNPFFMHIKGTGDAISHEQALDFRHGLFSRRTVWEIGGARVTFESRRFASMDDAHTLAACYRLTADSDIEITLQAGIDADVWDIHGPHYTGIAFRQEGDVLLCEAKAANGEKAVAVARRGICAAPEFTARLRAGEAFGFEGVACVFTTNDCASPAEAAMGHIKAAGGFDSLFEAHQRRWEEIWRVSEVEIGGAGEAARAVNYSLYHLNCIAPRSAGLSIPARGLSGQTYKGAVFWDTEIFMLDYFLHARPEVARRLIEYRIETLPGALEKAASYGHEGAFYAWESQEGGYDACSDYNVTDVFTGRPVRTYFRDKQMHISSAVVWALMRYVEHTGELDILRQGGARVVRECARFYLSLLVKRLNKPYYEIRDVIGPDEYHERVNNNAYTNRMAKFTFDSAIKVAGLLGEGPDTELEALLPRIKDAAERLYVPGPDKDGIVEQFDGYFGLEDATLGEVRARLKDPREYWGGGNGVASDTRIIKQADVAAMLELFHDEYGPEALRRNWAYYEPRTEHGSSLSACMYAMLACRFGRADLAYPFFLKSARAELDGGGKQWAGLVYIGGTHPAAAGGAWKVLAQAFAGLHFKDGEPRLAPCLPESFASLRFPFVWRGCVYDVAITREGAEIAPR
jgi:kojibiose phosphorylase/nigerose phosphorylase